jgi:DNA-binding NtrC family response regulator
MGRFSRKGESGRQAADARLSDSASRPARILVVEDQEDVRRMLVTALEIEGHRVDEAASAMEGLACLERARYDLVLSDYAMPGGTGTWMLHQATRRGLMESTVALIVTAHPDVRDLADVDVIPKPLDLDFFLEQVRRILERPPASKTCSSTSVSGSRSSSRHSSCSTAFHRSTTRRPKRASASS